jgi:hypothetical protein
VQPHERDGVGRDRVLGGPVAERDRDVLEAVDEAVEAEDAGVADGSFVAQGQPDVATDGGGCDG